MGKATTETRKETTRSFEEAGGDTPTVQPRQKGGTTPTTPPSINSLPGKSLGGKRQSKPGMPVAGPKPEHRKMGRNRGIEGPFGGDPKRGIRATFSKTPKTRPPSARSRWNPCLQLLGSTCKETRSEY